MSDGQAAAIASPADNSDAISYGRPPEIEDLTNRLAVHPLSAHVVRFGVATDLSPNAVSLAGLACGLAAAAAYFHQAAWLGFTLMFVWHVLDGADGKLARLTGKTSAFGRVLDGICDHLVYISVYVALSLLLMTQGWGAEIWLLSVGAGACHILHAAGYEERRQQYQRRKRGQLADDVERLAPPPATTLEHWYRSAQKLVRGPQSGLDEALAGARPAQVSQPGSWWIRTMETNRQSVRLWSALNANNRTLAIALFCLLGQPVLYFAYEIVVLSMIFLFLIVRQSQWEQAALRSAT